MPSRLQNICDDVIARGFQELRSQDIQCQFMDFEPDLSGRGPVMAVNTLLKPYFIDIYKGLNRFDDKELTGGVAIGLSRLATELRFGFPRRLVRSLRGLLSESYMHTNQEDCSRKVIARGFGDEYIAFNDALMLLTKTYPPGLPLKDVHHLQNARRLLDRTEDVCS